MAIDKKNSLVSVGDKQFQNYKIAAYNIASPCNSACPLYVTKDQYMNEGIDKKCGYQDDSIQCKVDQEYLDSKMSNIRALTKEAELDITTIQEIFDYVIPLYTLLSKYNRIAASVDNPYYMNRGSVQKHPVYEDIQKTNERIYKYMKAILGDEKSKKIKDITPSGGMDVLDEFRNS